jgi:ArsR family metal-binding transcriptional regulator
MNIETYLKCISLIDTTPCLAEPGKFIVTGKPSRSLSEVLPYLAALPGVIGFNPEMRTLTFRRPRGFMTLYSHRVSITQVKDAEEGLELFSALTEAINATWENRQKLKPIQTRKKPPGHLDIYALLPKTNCKACGEATCLAFSVSLLLQKKTLQECEPLMSNSSFEERRFALESLLS